MTFKKGVTRNPPDGDKIVWCPLCDWHLPDSFSTRRRLGEHVSDEHYDEIVFPKGTEPPDLEPKKRNEAK